MKKILISIFLSITFYFQINSAAISNVTKNSDPINEYDKFELTFNVAGNITNPYDPGNADVWAIFTSPSGVTTWVNAFYYQNYTLTCPGNGTNTDNTHSWKIRFAANQTGTWTYVIKAYDYAGTTGTSTTGSPFTCNVSTNKGFIRKTNNRYLAFDNGTQYVPVGEDVGWWDSGPNHGPCDYTTWLDNLSANGGNFFRHWMCSWATAIEWNDTGLGNYDARQFRAAYLDWIIDYARQKNIYIMLCLNNHGQVSTLTNPEWTSNPYYINNGGPCATTTDFFTNTTAAYYYERRMRYVVARWGYATNIMCWEMFNEVDWTDNFGSDPAVRADVTNWINEMAQYIRSIDPQQHLITTSYAEDIYDPNTWNLPIIDFTQLHHYQTVADASGRS